MATLWAVEGPHNTKPSRRIIFRSIAANDGSLCSVSKNSQMGLHLTDDHKVSRGEHAMVWYEEGRFWVKDAGSTNGTWIPEDDTLVRLGDNQKHPLDNLDEFVVGDTVIVLHTQDLDHDEIARLRDRRHEAGIRNAATLPRRVSGTEGGTVI